MHHTNRLRNQNVHACHLMQSAMTATAAVCSPLLFGIANIVTDQRYELLPAFKVYRHLASYVGVVFIFASDFMSIQLGLHALNVYSIMTAWDGWDQV